MAIPETLPAVLADPGLLERVVANLVETRCATRHRSIGRGFVEAMRGSITLDDTPGGGLTATVALPVAR